MSETRSRLQTESQYGLRVTARDPAFFEALQDFERQNTAKDLFLFAMTRIIVDESDSSNNYDHTSQNLSTFRQWRKGVEDASRRGLKRFELLDYVKEIKKGGNEGPLVGLGFRMKLMPPVRDAIIAPTLFSGATDKDKIVDLGRNLGYVPIAYRFNDRVRNIEQPLDRIESLMKTGAFVSQLTVVRDGTRGGREADIFREDVIDISDHPLDRRIASLPQPADVINLDDHRHEPDRSTG